MTADLIPGEGTTYLPIDTIRQGDRVRTDLGNIKELADSITAVGLLHPVVITGKRQLVAGGRRLAAVRSLGWTEVPVRVVDLATAGDALRAEADENTCRKPLTPYEATDMRRRQAEVLRPVAAENKGGRPSAVETGTKLEPVSTPSVRKVKNTAAIGTGYSGSSLDKVEHIRDVAERGVIRKGSREVAAPAPVVEVAKKALTEVKKTGAAIDRSHKAVEQSIRDYADSEAGKAVSELIDGSAAVRDAGYLRDFIKAVRKADDFLAFDAERVGQIGGDDELTSVRHLLESTKSFYDRMQRARSGLRIVNGGKQ